MSNNPEFTSNRIARYYEIKLDDEYLISGFGRQAPELVELLSLSRFCIENPVTRKLAYNPDRPGDIKERKTEINKSFNQIDDWINLLTGTAKYELFNELLKEVFNLAPLFPGLKGFYTDLCIERFKFQGTHSDLLTQAADSAAQKYDFDDDWHAGKMSLFLSKDVLHSRDWCEKRLAYINDALKSPDTSVDLYKILTAFQYGGLLSFLQGNPDKMSDLGRAYCRYVQEQLEIHELEFNPVIIYNSLKITGCLDYLRSREFRKYRNLALKHKFEDLCFADLPSFLAFYERDGTDNFSFSGADAQSLMLLRKQCKRAVINIISRGALTEDQNPYDGHVMEWRNAVKVACDVFLKDSFNSKDSHFTDRFYDAVIKGTIELFTSADVTAILPADIFTSLLPEHKLSALASHDDCSILMQAKLIKLANSFNIISKKLSELLKNGISPQEFKNLSEFKVLYEVYLPCIERLDYYYEMFGCEKRPMALKLPEKAVEVLQKSFNYTPGEFNKGIPDVYPQFSILTWHELNLNLRSKLESGEYRQALPVFNGLLQITRNGCVPLSENNFILSFPASQQQIIQTELHNMLNGLT